jgi:hypothetical protein
MSYTELLSTGQCTKLGIRYWLLDTATRFLLLSRHYHLTSWCGILENLWLLGW